MPTPLHRRFRLLPLATLAALLSIGSTAWSQGTYDTSPEVRQAMQALATDDAQLQASRWGVLATMAGKSWLGVVPGDIANLWRRASWVVPGAVLRFQRGFCIALKCQASDYLVQYDQKARQLQFFEDGSMAYTGHLQDDGSVRLKGTGLVGVLTAETLRYDTAKGAVFADAHELQPATTAQVAAATHGFVADQAVQPGTAAPPPAAIPAPPAATASAAPASSDAALRAELAAMRARVDQLSRQLEQSAPAAGPASSPQPRPLTPAQARAKAASEQRLAAALAREEAQARAAEAQRLAAERRAQAEQDKRLQAQAQARQAQERAEQARRLADERRAQQEEARRLAEEQSAREEANRRQAEFARLDAEAAARKRRAPQAAAAPARQAATGDAVRAGTYSTGTGYSIDVQASGDSLVVTEPNKTSEYRRTAPGSNVYRYVNPNTGTAFALTVAGPTTLVASRFGSAGEVLPNGTALKLVGGGPAQAAGDSTYKAMDTVAQKYLRLAQTDPANAQAWSFCGLAAMALAQGQGEQQVQQAAAALKSIATTAQTPCPDAIGHAVWNSVP